jgi:hypothetical protein
MRCALIVSVNRYTNYGPLRYCHTDGHLLAQTLTSLCDYHRRCTVRHLKLDREAGHELPGRLLAAIREIDAADQASVRSGDDPAGDSFLFYFAGHGVHDAATQRSYLLLPGSRPDALAETALSLGALREALSGLRRPIVQIVDACHSGEAHRGEPGSRSPELRGFVSELKRDVDLGEEVGHDGQFGWETFAACDEGEYSHEAHELQHGVFTHALAQAIRGAPVGAALQLASLKDVVCGEVRRWTTDRGLVQNPVFAARTYGAHCFARRNHQPVPPTSLHERAGRAGADSPRGVPQRRPAGPRGGGGEPRRVSAARVADPAAVSAEGQLRRRTGLVRARRAGSQQGRTPRRAPQVLDRTRSTRLRRTL